MRLAPITAADIDAAPMFAVFEGADVPTLHQHRDGDRWAIFDEAPMSAAVHAEARRRGIPDPGGAHVERCDDVAPEHYTDTHAAADAIRAGYTIAKLPDAIGSDAWRAFVLDPNGRVPVSREILARIIGGVL